MKYLSQEIFINIFNLLFTRIKPVSGTGRTTTEILHFVSLALSQVNRGILQHRRFWQRNKQKLIIADDGGLSR